MNDRLATFYTFMNELSKGVPDTERLTFVVSHKDPVEMDGYDWRVHRWRSDAGIEPDDDLNLYVCAMSSIIQYDQRGKPFVKRRCEQDFGHGLCLMIDDIGNGAGSKNPLSLIAALRPTVIVETSPENYQAFYFMKEPEPDRIKFDALINAFITAKYLGKDTGQAGVNRVFRPPYGSNRKKKYINADGTPFKVKLMEADYSLRYSPEEIAEAFRLELIEKKKVERETLADVELIVAQAEFDEVVEAFYAANSVVREKDQGAKYDVVCPNIGNHSDKNAITGSTLIAPNPYNHWQGAYKCHHRCGAEGKGYSWVKAKLRAVMGANWNAGPNDEQLNKPQNISDFEDYFHGN